MRNLALWMLPIAVLAVSCATSSRDAMSAAKLSCCATNANPSTTHTDQSLYQLDSMWTNDAGQPVKLGALQGRVQVVVMFFARCTYACPIIVHDLKRIEAALPEPLRANTGFTLVTIDPERDTTEALHAFREGRKLPADRWTLLRGAPDDTLELAALLGVKFKREAGGQFAHSNLITVLNEQGEIIHQLVGLNQDIQQTAQAIERAASATRRQPLP
jgi:protein SCO1/2